LSQEVIQQEGSNGDLTPFLFFFVMSCSVNLLAALGGTVIEKLFVYGTLGPDRPNEHVLDAIGGSWETATVSGILREEGWGAEMGYGRVLMRLKVKLIVVCWQR
jgi:hypothetical protein